VIFKSVFLAKINKFLMIIEKLSCTCELPTQNLVSFVQLINFRNSSDNFSKSLHIWFGFWQIFLDSLYSVETNHSEALSTIMCRKNTMISPIYNRNFVLTAMTTHNEASECICTLVLCVILAVL